MLDPGDIEVLRYIPSRADRLSRQVFAGRVPTHLIDDRFAGPRNPPGGGYCSKHREGRNKTIAAVRRSLQRLRKAELAEYLVGNGKGWGRTWEGDRKIKEIDNGV